MLDKTKVQRCGTNSTCRRLSLAEKTSAQWTTATFVVDVERKPQLVVA